MHSFYYKQAFLKKNGAVSREVMGALLMGAFGMMLAVAIFYSPLIKSVWMNA